MFNGADGSQMAFWICRETATSAEHVHDYDEYMIVVESCHPLLIQGQRNSLKSGQEYFLPKGISHGGEVAAETRTIHAFGGARAKRAQQSAVMGAASIGQRSNFERALGRIVSYLLRQTHQKNGSTATPKVIADSIS